ncbi:MAG: nucleotidyl transferase AbiEii/AbiGii toxin family protein [Verrucomicrobia bacterium]|nr:nucleotidyl transferase AbiEii/AbiGii toxin family protein [Verrucomicrobiota bacterium]
MDKAYIETVRLLLEAIPAVFKYPAFAMKGGTAINLFVEDMPRLSVDIDVVCTDYQAPREQALAAISTALMGARDRLRSAGLDGEVTSSNLGDETKLFIRRDRSQVKVEVNHVFRGTVLPPASRSLGPEARRVFTTEVSAPVLATSELYGSKLVAANDRSILQPPPKAIPRRV